MFCSPLFFFELPSLFGNSALTKMSQLDHNGNKKEQLKRLNTLMVDFPRELREEYMPLSPGKSLLRLTEGAFVVQL